MALPRTCGKTTTSVTTEALPLANPTSVAGTMSWLTSKWRQLKALVDSREATQEDVDMLHTIEIVTERCGKPLLKASSLDNLDDRIDELIDSPETYRSITLLNRHAARLLAPEFSADAFADAIGDILGEAQGRTIAQAHQLIDAWLDAQRQMLTLTQCQASTGFAEVNEADNHGDLTITNADIPADIALLIYHGIRANLCSLAITRIAIEDMAEPWLAKALTDRLIESARQHLRFLASIPGIAVDEAVIPLSERLDLHELDARHERAKATYRRKLEAARTRIGR